jgi:phenylacetate-coenzyme A ligase PaaK-like adenylate-forming protein
MRRARESAMNATDQLFDTDPFDFSDASRELFMQSFRDCAQIHYQHNALLRGLWQEAGLQPQDLRSELDLQRMPMLMVNLFKEHELMTGPPEDIVLNLTSSGTGGQKSQIFLDQASLARVKKLAWEVHAYLGMVSEEAVNYLCFTYDPRVATNLGTAFTDELLTGFTGKKEVYYAIQWNEAKQDFFLNVEGVIATLQRFAADGAPTRILGFPAHLYKIIKDHDLHVTLPANSWVQTGGGWKGFVNEEVPKEKFRSFIAERLGIPEANVRDLFGMVEHGIPYVDCERGRLHVPNYARVFIRSPRDLSLLPEGETGLMQFVCSYISSYPSISLLTSDYGKLGRCDCGRAGHTLEITGRAGVQKHKGCALTASKLLE